MTARPQGEQYLGEKVGGTDSFKLRKHQHSRTVSYDELHQMGLARAVDEYHKMIVSKSKSCGMTSFCASNRFCIVKLLVCLLLRPLPTFLRPECVICGCKTAWTVIFARFVKQSAVILIPLALSFCLLPEQYSLEMPVWGRCMVLSMVVMAVYVADRSLSGQGKVCDIPVKKSLEKYFHSGELNMSTSQASDVSFLRIFDSREDIEARRKEKMLITNVKKLVLRYGLFAHGEEGQIANVFIAYRWINRLAEELEEDQLRYEENFTLDSALDAVSILQESIGSH